MDKKRRLICKFKLNPLLCLMVGDQTSDDELVCLKFQKRNFLNNVNHDFFVC